MYSVKYKVTRSRSLGRLQYFNESKPGKLYAKHSIVMHIQCKCHWDEAKTDSKTH